MASVLTHLIDQTIHIVPSFTLECGQTLHEVPVAYKTWGKLNEFRDNVMIICHAFTGSADVEDWWGPLMGSGKAFDPTRYFIFCANVLGSPYGSASPITNNPDTGKPYGPEFPPTTIRDDVRIHKLVLDSLSVSSVAVAIGGSMGGMAVLEWPLCTPKGYIRHIIPIATSARHSAWCISWGEAQRQSIYSDPVYQDGYYYLSEGGHQPRSGLAAARMSALLTYRSRDSFESRFGRRSQNTPVSQSGVLTPPRSPPRTLPRDDALAAHNDGHRSARTRTPIPAASNPSSSSLPISAPIPTLPTNGDSITTNEHPTSPKPPVFSAQSYLRYQGDKFTARFDANCYIHITRKMDSHDIARGRWPPTTPPSSTTTPDWVNSALLTTYATSSGKSVDPLAQILALLPPSLILSVQSDGLFTPSEQSLLARYIPESELYVVQSGEGHDGFLLEFEIIDGVVGRWLRGVLGDYYEGDQGVVEGEGFEVKKTSIFGEAEVDITRW